MAIHHGYPGEVTAAGPAPLVQGASGPRTSQPMKVPLAATNWLQDKLLARQWNRNRLVAESGIAHATVYEVCGGRRAMSPAVALKLAATLCPVNDEVRQREFQAQLLSAAGYSPEFHIPAARGVLDRVLRDRKIRCGYVISEPFVKAPVRDGEAPTGLAVDLFNGLADILGAAADGHWRRYRLDQLDLAARETDIIVSAILPTAQCAQYMDFSRHFPFLRVALSGVVRKADADFWTLDRLLDLRRQNVLEGRRVLLVNSEVGHQFAKMFLRGLDRDSVDSGELLSSQVEVVRDDLGAAQLRDRLTAVATGDAANAAKAAPSLLLANAGTCRAIVEMDRGMSVVPLRGSGYARHGLSVESTADGEFAVLASYPIAFGLPKSDDRWNARVNEAFTYLMSEGLLTVLAAYHEHRLALRNFVCSQDSDFAFLWSHFASMFPEEEPESAAGRKDQSARPARLAARAAGSRRA